MIPEGKSGAGWQSFVTTCEELISVIRDLRCKTVGPVDFSVKKGISFADKTRSSLPETKVEGKPELRNVQGDVGSLPLQKSVGFPMTPHAKSVVGYANSHSNHLEGPTALAASSDWELWAHLMKIQAELEAFFELVKKKKGASGPLHEPNHDLCCLEALLEPVVIPDSSGLELIGTLFAEGDSDGTVEALSLSARMLAAFKVLVVAAPGFGSDRSTQATELLAVCDSLVISDVRQPGLLSGVADVGGGELLVSGKVLSPASEQAVGFSVGSISALGGDSPLGGSDLGALTSQQLSEVRLGGEAVAPLVQHHIEEGSGGALVSLEGGVGDFCVAPLRILLPRAERFDGAGSGESSRHLVRVSCTGYETDLLNLFVALEMERGLGSKSLGRSGGKLLRELKSLECSVNYNGNASGSRRSRKDPKGSC
ncbi:hypothetical protein CJ030_MR3G015809 [Morella rubra]|uniref:Uncharacterized protein n=1 Tax=Morella rubra TaxID=262757 RepID=A0A6A1W8B2_9ROSI|nr:hypothetical protein CJ030_MR3G015809 [Morella rubra]